MKVKMIYLSHLYITLPYLHFLYAFIMFYGAGRIQKHKDIYMTLPRQELQLPFIGEIPGYYYGVHMWMKTVNIF